jgi:predicted HTH transcriptional regulator
MTVEIIQSEESLIAMGSDVEKERPKVEFKFKWPDLKSEPGVSEFLKDVSAMANTVGLDGFLIFGYEPKADKDHQVSFKDSNLRDQSDI